MSMDANNNKKRPRTKADDGTSPACDQCRARKIRCDRRQPECSNCQKANVSCDFSNAVKRVNHTKQLVDDMAAVTARLDSIDSSLARVIQQIDSLTKQSSSLHGVQSAPGSICCPDDIRGGTAQAHSTDSGVDFLDDVAGDDDPIAIHGLEVDRGGERLYGYPASLSLFKSSHRLLVKALTDGGGSVVGTKTPELPPRNLLVLAANNDSLRPKLQQLETLFPFRGKCREPVFVGDRRPIALPPRSLLEASIDCFLHDINAHMPIFDEVRLRATIEAQYAPDATERSVAYSLCFSNIILLTLGLKSRVARVTASQHGGMDDDLLASFLVNCHRALENIDTFARPSVPNVQALATLVLVAREYYSNLVFERVCQLTCQVARSMGLQQAYTSRAGSSESAAERQRIFWMLYVLDKERVFLTGQPCDLYLFDSDIQLGACESKSAGRQISSAVVHMMSIWEKIYVALYSSRSTRKGPLYRANQVQILKNLFHEWYLQYEELFNPSLQSQGEAVQHLQSELRYIYHVGKILFLRCDLTYGSQQQSREHARLALKIIGDVYSASKSTSSCAVLGRLFRNYPMVAFHDLYTLYIAQCGLDSADHVDLLAAVCHYLEPLKHPDFPDVYYTRLHLGLTWCMDLVDVVKETAQQLHRTSSANHSGLISPASLSRAYSAININTGHARPSLQVPDSQTPSPTTTGAPARSDTLASVSWPSVSSVDPFFFHGVGARRAVDPDDAAAFANMPFDKMVDTSGAQIFPDPRGAGVGSGNNTHKMTDRGPTSDGVPGSHPDTFFDTDFFESFMTNGVVSMANWDAETGYDPALEQIY